MSLMSTQSTLPPFPRGLRTDAHLGASLLICPGGAGARVPAPGGEQVLRAALPSAALEDRVSPQHFQSVLTSAAALLPSLLQFPIRLIHSTPAAWSGGRGHTWTPRSRAEPSPVLSPARAPAAASSRRLSVDLESSRSPSQPPGCIVF